MSSFSSAYIGPRRGRWQATSPQNRRLAAVRMVVANARVANSEAVSQAPSSATPVLRRLFPWRKRLAADGFGSATALSRSAGTN